MSTDRIKHGETFTLVGTVAASETLIGLTGDPAALIEVSGTARNLGTIELYGASLPHKQGATLNVTGVLASANAISVGGASNSAHGALLQIGGTLTNTGALKDQAGTDGAGGRITVQGGGHLRNSGTITLAAGAAAGSAGATLNDTGVLTNSTTGVIDLAGALGAGSGAVLDVSGTLTNDGMLKLYAALYAYDKIGGATLAVEGLLQNAGTIAVGLYQLPPNQRAAYESAPALLSVSGTLANTGSIYVTGSSGTPVHEQPGPGSTLAITGTLINQGEIALQYGGIGGHYFYQGYAALLQNTGTIENSGLLSALGSSSYPTAPFPEIGATIADIGVLTNTGTVWLQQNTDLTITGTLANSALLQADGGSSFVYLDSYRGNGAKITLDGVMTNSGTAELGGGVTGPPGYHVLQLVYGLGSQFSISGAGILTNTNTGLVDIGGGDAGPYPGQVFETGAGATLSIGGVMTNYGNVDIMPGQTSSYGVAGTGGLLLDSGFLNNRSGVITVAGGIGTATGVLQVAPGGVLGNSDGTINGTGELLNLGVTELFGGNSKIDVTSLINDGTIQALESFTSVDTIDSAITADPGQTGMLTLLNETLRLNAAVAASQTVAFVAYPDGNKSTLELNDLAAFAGTLGGIAAGDIIDFLKQDVTSATSAGDTLAIGLSTGTTIDLALTAPLAGLSLTLKTDSHGGTDLVFSIAPAI